MYNKVSRKDIYERLPLLSIPRANSKNQEKKRKKKFVKLLFPKRKKPAFWGSLYMDTEGQNAPLFEEHYLSVSNDFNSVVFSFLQPPKLDDLLSDVNHSEMSSSPIEEANDNDDLDRPPKKSKQPKRRLLVCDIMSRKPINVAPDTNLAEAVRIMSTKVIHRLPVVRGNR